MNEIDKDGLYLCNMQGKLFEESLKYVQSSSEIFIRRFMNSFIATYFDSTSILDDSYSNKAIFDEIEKEYGITSYGKVKYNNEVLFWIGYIYRYFSYTYDLSSKQVYKIIKPKELNEIYYVYHSFDCAVAINRILEYKKISSDEESKSARLFSLLKKYKYIESTSLVPMNNELIYKYFKEENDGHYTLKEDDSIDYKINNFKLKNKSKEILAIKYNNKVIGYACLNNLEINLIEVEYEIKKTFVKENYEQIVLEKLGDYLKEKKKFIIINNKKSS